MIERPAHLTYVEVDMLCGEVANQILRLASAVHHLQVEHRSMLRFRKRQHCRHLHSTRHGLLDTDLDKIVFGHHHGDCET